MKLRLIGLLLSTSAMVPAAYSQQVSYEQVSPIIEANCGSCHSEAVGLGGIVLDNPEALDLAAALVIPAVEQGRMPPNNPDFNQSSEASLLLEYLVSRLEKPEVSFEDAARIIDANCISCHSAAVALGGVVLETQEQLKLAAPFVIAAVEEARMPPTNPDFNQTDDASLLLDYLGSQLDAPQISFEDVAPIFEANCVGCHSGIFAAGRVRLTSEEEALKAAEKIFTTVSTGRMPPRNPAFADSEEASLILSWLEQIAL